MNELKTITIVGATGLVGSHFVASELFPKTICIARAKPHWWPKSLAFHAVDAFDSNTAWSRFIPKNSPIIFLAFPTSIDAVEMFNESDENNIVNGFQAFVHFAKKNKSPLMFISSDAVLWGAPPASRDVDCYRSPLNKYGKLKGICEQILTKGTRPKGSCVVRCTPIGIHPFLEGHGFLSSMLKRAATETVVGFTDSLISPVSCINFIEFSKQWITAIEQDLEIPKILHLGSSTPLSKFEVLKTVFAKNLMDDKIRAAKFDSKLFNVTRVADQSFLVSKIKWFRPISISDVLATV